MAGLELDLPSAEPRYLQQVEYALAFVAEEVQAFDIDEEAGVVRLTLGEGADEGAVRDKVSLLLTRYLDDRFGDRTRTYFEQEGKLARPDAWEELLERRWVTIAGQGHVILRGPAAALMRAVDAVVVRDFANHFDAEEEVYPSTILCETLDRCNHYSSFPEHVDFVAHLRSDVEVLGSFAEACRESGWKGDLHEGRMAEPDFAVSPSCCYHCYEGMEGWDLEPPGRCVTAVLGCHRYEGANHQTLRRLRAFTMREVIWVGAPAHVLERRAEADEMIRAWAERWELDCSYEVANDMFFTDNYSVRASFQRQQEAKKELRATLAGDGYDLSVFSSNFHATTFGKAFGITVGGRPAVSACLGWGLERIVFALLSQHGLEPEGWPEALREDYRQLGGSG